MTERGLYEECVENEDGNFVRGIHKRKPRMMNELEGNSSRHCLEAEVVITSIYVKGYGFKFCRYCITL